MAPKIGLFFQKKFGEALKNVPGAYPLPITDTRSSGNWQGEKPGDFLLAYGGKCLLIECKATEKYVGLKEVKGIRNLVKDHQVAKHRRWMETGNPAFFPVYSELTGRVEFWSSMDLVPLFQQERVSAKGLHEPLIITPLDDVRHAIPELLDLFREKHPCVLSSHST